MIMLYFLPIFSNKIFSSSTTLYIALNHEQDRNRDKVVSNLSVLCINLHSSGEGQS